MLIIVVLQGLAALQKSQTCAHKFKNSVSNGPVLDQEDISDDANLQ